MIRRIVSDKSRNIRTYKKSQLGQNLSKKRKKTQRPVETTILAGSCPTDFHDFRESDVSRTVRGRHTLSEIVIELPGEKSSQAGNFPVFIQPGPTRRSNHY